MLILADTSALIWAERHPESADARRFGDDIRRGAVALCDAVRLEFLRGFPTRSAIVAADEHLRHMPRIDIDRHVFLHAGEIQAALADRPGSLHRSTPVMDLLVAGAALVRGAIIMHRDRDFEAISAVTGQPTRWLGPPAAQPR